MLKTAEKINCHIPLTFIQQCQSVRKESLNDVFHTTKHLDQTDKNWSEFLKAQQDSSANYLYKTKIFGNAKDPILVIKEPVPDTLIHQCLSYMTDLGGLVKADMFYVLSFILNIKNVNPEKQQEYMEHLQNLKLLDLEILNYMQIVARRPNAGLTVNELKDFENITQLLIDRVSPQNYHNYFNSDHIFIKCMVEIDPYELAYLEHIMNTDGKLNLQEFLYLVNFVERLQEMQISQRDEYLKLLYDKNILCYHRFDCLVAFMHSKAKKVNQNKLKMLLKELFTLMDIGPCIFESEKPPVKKSKPLTIDVNYRRISKALKALMKPGIPNIVRVMDLKNFLNEVLLLQPYQMENVFMGLKNGKVLNAKRVNFIQNFIASRQLCKGDPSKKKLLLQIMKQVIEAPLSGVIALKLDIQTSKGPKVETSINEETIIENKAKSEKPTNKINEAAAGEKLVIQSKKDDKK